MTSNKDFVCLWKSHIYQFIYANRFIEMNWRGYLLASYIKFENFSSWIPSSCITKEKINLSFSKTNVCLCCFRRGFRQLVLIKQKKNLMQGELECRCEGVALTRIPQTLHNGMQKLTITKAGIPFLRSVGLRIYSNSLQDM